LGATGTLNHLIEIGDPFFLEWHSVREITDHCNKSMQKEWKTTDFTSILTRALASGKLVRFGENEPKFRKA
jgi:hypothetical protein